MHCFASHGFFSNPAPPPWLAAGAYLSQAEPMPALLSSACWGSPPPRAREAAGDANKALSPPALPGLPLGQAADSITQNPALLSSVPAAPGSIQCIPVSPAHHQLQPKARTHLVFSIPLPPPPAKHNSDISGASPPSLLQDQHCRFPSPAPCSHSHLSFTCPPTPPLAQVPCVLPLPRML